MKHQKRMPLTTIFAATAFFLTFLLCAHSLFAAEDAWKSRMNEDGISVSTRRVEGSSILEFKSSLTLNAPLDKVLQLYTDAEKLPLWYHQCVKAQILRDEGPLQTILYLVVHLPWPVSERDSVVKSVKSVDPATGAITYSLSALPTLLPVQKGKVRVLYLKSTWRFTPLPDGRTQMDFQQHSNPGGSIPAVLVNKLVLDIPYNSLKNFRRMVEDQKERSDK